MSIVVELRPGKIIRVSPRFLKPNQLGGLIFGCTDSTIEEGLTQQLFGLPGKHIVYVRNIQPGLALFLFNTTTRQLHGIFEAASFGQLNINPHAWTKHDSEKTPYPAQVQIRVQRNCHPLLLEEFQPIIKKNYYTYTMFRFELDKDQVRELIDMFITQVVAPSVDVSQQNILVQEENNKEDPLLPSDVQSSIAELQELKAKKESVKMTGQLPNSQQKLLSEVQILKDHSTRVEATEAMESGSEQHLDPDGLIYLAGGHDGTSWLASLDCYSPSEDKLFRLRDMPSIRAYASLAKLKGDLYVIGGGYADAGLWYNTVDSYSPQNNEWTSRPCLNDKKGGLAAITLDEKIYAIGGGDGIRCFSDVEMFDIDIGQWKPARSMQQKRFDLAAAELNGAIYAVGGYDGKEYLSSAERYDPREKCWSRLKSMSSKKACYSLVVLNEKLYAIGGYDGSNMVASVEVFDPRHGSWMNEEPMNLSRGFLAAAVLGGSIYAIGGVGEDQHNVLDKVERYQEGDGWQLTNLKAVGKRIFASAIVMSL